MLQETKKKPHTQIMKLAEALRHRADISEKLSNVRERIKDNCKIQEGDEPPEDLDELLKEADRLEFKLTKLITQIHLVNGYVTLLVPTFLESTNFEKAAYTSSALKIEMDGRIGKTIMEALAERDALKRRIKALERLIEASNVTQSFNYSKSEIKIVSLTKGLKLHEKRDKLSLYLRILDIKIQEANWKYDMDETMKKILDERRPRTGWLEWWSSRNSCK